MDDTSKLATYGSDGTCQNPACNRKTVKKGPYGPPRQFCSNACRVAAYRQRQPENAGPAPASEATGNVTDDAELQQLRATVAAIYQYVNNPELLRAVAKQVGGIESTAWKILADVTAIIEDR